MPRVRSRDAPDIRMGFTACWYDRGMIVRTVDGLLIALWIGVCAAVPEVLWQGGRALLAHGDVADLLVPAILVGLFLAFFVEPLVERLRAGSWAGHHHARRSLPLTVACAVGLGLVTVCLHECIAAVMHSKTGLRYPELDGPREALRIAVEWAFIPVCQTLAWLIGARDRRAGALVAVAACPAVLAITLWAFRWEAFDAFVSTGIATIASLVVILWPLHRPQVSASQLLQRMALVAALSFAVCLGCLVVTTEFLVPTAFGRHAYGDDLRFYLGWVLGLSFVPTPAWISAARAPSAAAPS